MSAEAWRDAFESFVHNHTERDPAWLQRLRDEAFGLFVDQGLPTTRLEEWRYTSLSALERAEFWNGGTAKASTLGAPELRATLDRTAISGVGERFVCVDGQYATELSSPGSGTVESLAAMRRRAPSELEGRLGRLVAAKHHAFVALNTAMLDDGAVLRVPDGTQLEEPIHVVFVASATTGRAHHPRVLVEMGASSHATLVVDHVSAGTEPTLCNIVTEIIARENSSLDLVILQRESDSAFHVSNTSVQLDRDARVATHTVTLGGTLVRNDLSVRLVAEGGECVMNGLFFTAGEALVDNHTQVDHAAPNGQSRELYKGILTGKSRGVFRGRVIVAPDAQKTDADQKNPNLLLASGAEINSRPQLEIHADDVRCSHGTSIGKLDENALFYLRSRGIESDRATALLVQGFANEILESLPVAGATASLQADLQARLRASESPS